MTYDVRLIESFDRYLCGLSLDLSQLFSGRQTRPSMFIEGIFSAQFESCQRVFCGFVAFAINDAVDMHSHRCGHFAFFAVG